MKFDIVAQVCTTIVSRSMRSAWIEIYAKKILKMTVLKSRSMRSAWIEITMCRFYDKKLEVALHAERVD